MEVVLLMKGGVRLARAIGLDVMGGSLPEDPVADRPALDDDGWADGPLQKNIQARDENGRLLWIIRSSMVRCWREENPRLTPEHIASRIRLLSQVLPGAPDCA